MISIVCTDTLKTYCQLKLRSDVPLNNINSKFYQNIIENFPRTAFRIVRSKRYSNARYWENGNTT